jgi:drug/metabolite transporter (DMT)-like permease
MSPVVRNAEGALFVLGAAILWAVESAVIRGLGERVSLIEIVVLRVLGQLLFVAPWFVRYGARTLLATDRMQVHVLRGGLSLAAWWTYYYSVSVLPLAVSTVVSFANVPFAVALAAPVLKERVGAARWLATLVGFAGIVLAVQPAGVSGLPGVVAGVVSACLGGAIILTTRYLSSREQPRTVMAYISLVTAAGTLPLAVPQWDQLSFDLPPEVLVVVLLAPVSMWLMILGFRVGEASAIAPVSYFRLIVAAVLGWYFLDELPETPMLFGGLIVVGAVVFLTLYERRRRPPGI